MKLYRPIKEISPRSFLLCMGFFSFLSLHKNLYIYFKEKVSLQKTMKIIRSFCKNCEEYILLFTFQYISKSFLLITLFFSFYCSNAQNKNSEIKAIDSLIEVANDLYMDDNSSELFTISYLEITPKSKKINYERGSCFGNFYIASALSFVGRYKESNTYIKKAQSYTAYLAKDPMQESRNYGLIGDNFYEIGFYTLAARNYHKTINILKNKKNKNVIDSLTESSTYATLATLYQKVNLQDSVYYYLTKEQNILKSITFEKAYIEKGNSYIGLGDYYLKNKNIDSASYYYHKSLLLFDKKNECHEIGGLIGLGNVYSAENKNDQAVSYYLMALKKSNNSNKNVYLEKVIYEKLKNIYVKSGDIEKAFIYSKLFSKIDDSLDLSLNKQRNFILNQVIKDANEKQNIKSKNRFYLGGIFLLVLIVSIFFFFFNFVRKKESDTIKMLNQKETLIIEKEKYTAELEQKLKLSLEEIIEEAKNNTPIFIEKFQLMYPSFRSRLLKVNSTLNSNELTLLAYVYLNFSSKEIADYTFRSYRTIQTRKYNLRKKLGLNTNEDLLLWLKGVC